MRKSELEDGKYWKTQKEVVYDYLKDKTATASMVKVATGIPQKYITRIKSSLEDELHNYVSKGRVKTIIEIQKDAISNLSNQKRA